MASASMNMQGLDNLRRWESVGQLMDSAATVLEGELQQGKDEMQSMIESRGTGRTWSEYWQRRTGRTGSIPGRVQTGDMRNDVEGKITRRSSTEVEGVLGWDENSPMYYAYQEEGFYSLVSQESVKGMHALRDAGEATRDRLIVALNRMVIK